MRLTELAHELVRARLASGDMAIDATAGNGHDTLFLADVVGPTGRVFAFDVQEQAIAATRLRAVNRPWVTLVCAGHEHMQLHIPAHVHGHVGAVMFNLGYHPGGDKTLVTRPVTTMAALTQAIALLKPGGIITVMLYRGHDGGSIEADAVTARAATAAGFDQSHHRQPGAAADSPSLLTLTRQPG